MMNLIEVRNVQLYTCLADGEGIADGRSCQWEEGKPMGSCRWGKELSMGKREFLMGKEGLPIEGTGVAAT